VASRPAFPHAGIGRDQQRAFDGDVPIRTPEPEQQRQAAWFDDDRAAWAGVLETPLDVVTMSPGQAHT
jgi:hypothetical protein